MRRSRFLAVVMVVLLVDVGVMRAQEAAKSSARPAPKQSPEARFRELDTDGDGALSREELLAKVAEEKRKERTRDFQLLDFDGDGRLSLDEYRNVPGVASRDQRGPVPDPIVDQMEKQLAELSALLKRAGAGSDSTWSRQEWPEADVAKLLPSRSLASFDQWDRNQNGQVEAVELRFRLEVLFGIRHETGPLLRRKTGDVFFLRAFRDRDRNSDLVITAKEFVAFKGGKLQTFRQWLERLDEDRDGRLSLAEMTRRLPVFWTNAIDRFRQFDANLDGLVSREEIARCRPSWDPQIVRQILPPFDLDDDGQLSFLEFRVTPAANEYVKWHPHDTNGDGRIDLQEYHGSQSPTHIAVSHFFLTRLDKDHGGYLSLDEIAFNIQVNTVPLEVLFRARDTNRDGRWSLAEAAGPASARGGDRAILRKREERLMRIEDAFRMADANSDKHLTLKELQTSEDAVSVLFPGRTGRSRSPGHGARVGATDETNHSWNWRLIGLLTFNILLWAGLAWLVLRPRKAGS